MSAQDQEPTYLEQVLGERRGRGSGEASHYLGDLGKLYDEFDYNFPTNQKLEDFFAQSAGADRGIISLSSSYTRLPPPFYARAIADRIATEKEEELFGRVDALIKEMSALKQEGMFLQAGLDQMASMDKKTIEETEPKVFLAGLARTMVTVGSEKTAAAKSHYDAEHKALHPEIVAFIEDFIAHPGSRNYNFPLPKEPAEIHMIKQDLVGFMAETWDYLLNREGGIIEQANDVAERMKEESTRVPSQEELIEMVEELQREKLKPAVAKHMSLLHGFNEAEVKQDNITLIEGSCTHIADVALEKLVEKPANGYAQPKNPKKMIAFSMSWDGLKVAAEQQGLELSLVHGPVSAQALDAHIQENILQGMRYEDDPAQAQREVRNQVGVLMLNIPENPLGILTDHEEMQALADVINKYDIPLVIADEIFAAPGHESLLNFEGMEDRCYLVAGTSKILNLDGKMSFGYSVNDGMARQVEESIGEEHKLSLTESLYFATLLDETPTEYYAQNQNEYARKRELVSEEMDHVNDNLGLEEGMRWLREPTYGCLGVISFPLELTEQCGIENSIQLAEYLYKYSGVKTTPIGDVMPGASEEPLGVRVNFSGGDHLLAQAVQRMGVAMQHMQEAHPYREIEGNRYRGDHRRQAGTMTLGEMIAMSSYISAAPGTEF